MLPLFGNPQKVPKGSFKQASSLVPPGSAAILLVVGSSPGAGMMGGWLRTRLIDGAFAEARSLTTALLLCMATRFLFVDQRLIVSNSMEPTLAVGDRVCVDKASILLRRVQGRSLGLRRNDMIVFRPPESCRVIFADMQENATPPGRDEFVDLSSWMRAWERRRKLRRTPLNRSLDFTKRVVAVAGDRVSTRRGLLYINEHPETPFPEISWLKLLPHLVIAKPSGDGGKEFQLTAVRASYDMSSTVVPEDHVLVLGDCRDASFDSHVWGPLPTQNVIGRVGARYWPVSRMAWFRRDRAL